MGIITDLAKEIELGSSLHDIMRAQHEYHESRRWSVVELIADSCPATSTTPTGRLCGTRRELR